MNGYRELSQQLGDLMALEEVLGLLQWDQEIVMPAGAIESRGRQVATLSVLQQERWCAPRLGELLGLLQSDETLDDVENANVREALREHNKAAKLPSDLVRRWGERTVAGHEVWVQARKAKDFSQFAPVLQELIDLSRQKAAILAPDQPAYDVLIDDFEPGMTMARLDKVFEPLKAFLIPLLAQVRQRQSQPGLPDIGFLTHPVPATQQREVGEKLVRTMGFDFERGRLDTSVHPFCGGAGPSDVRITTRYNENAWCQSLTAMIHETGHALYEQGRNLALANQPVSRARSMGVHESQSLLWEKQVGQSADFWRPRYAALQQDYTFLQQVPFDDFVYGVNYVDLNNFIRVEADELTYPLHVILRYELERDLISGALAVADLPAAWNQKMQHYLGITPPDDALGCLQDVHWSAGLFGYFPCYTLGALYAAQLFQTAVARTPGLLGDVQAGNLQPLLAWLRANIHQLGSQYLTDELITRATGRPLDPHAFIAYAGRKYRSLLRL